MKLIFLKLCEYSALLGMLSAVAFGLFGPTRGSMEVFVCFLVASLWAAAWLLALDTIKQCYIADYMIKAMKGNLPHDSIH